MNQRSLKNCISTLRELRDARSSQLDTVVLAELDELITDLERVSEQQSDSAEVRELTMRGLQLVAVVLHIVTNVRDWMK